MDTTNLSQQNSEVAIATAKIDETEDHIVTATDLLSEQPVEFTLTLSSLSLDVMILIFDRLHVKEVLKLECLSRQIQMAVLMHLKVRNAIDLSTCSKFCNTSHENEKRLKKKDDSSCGHENKSNQHGHSSNKHFPDINDSQFSRLLARMPSLQYIYNLSPEVMDSDRSVFGRGLSVEGVTGALAQHPRLRGVQINNSYLLEAVLDRLPDLQVLGCYRSRGRDSDFPAGVEPIVDLPQINRVTQVYLEDCFIETVPEFGTQLKSLFLRNLRFGKRNPFRAFDAPGMEQFVMTGCQVIKSFYYHELLTTLCQCSWLNCLELQVYEEFPGFMVFTIFTRYSHLQPFSAIHTLMLKLDSRLPVLRIVEASFASLKTLHLDSPTDGRILYMQHNLAPHSHKSKLRHLKLGWYPNKHEGVKRQSRCHLSKRALQSLAECFPQLETLEIENQNFIENMFLWQPEFCTFLHLRSLTLSNCGNVDGSSFTKFLQCLPCLQNLTMVNLCLKPVEQATSQTVPAESSNNEAYHVDTGMGGSKVGKKRCSSASQQDDDAGGKKQKIHSDDIADRKRQIDEENLCKCKPKIQLIHPRLQSLRFTNVDVTSLEMAFSQIKSLYISDCEHLGPVTYAKTPDLPIDHATPDITNVHHVTPDLQRDYAARDLIGVRVCGCPLVDEVDLMDSISRQHVGYSLFVHLTPKHKINLESVCETAWSEDHGHVFVFDFSADPLETEYNVIRAESWLPLLDHLTKASQREFQDQYHPTGAKKKQNSVYKLQGENENGSQWMLITDVPWLRLLTECPDLDTKTAAKAGVYCREAKGHRNAEEVYNSLKDHIKTAGDQSAGWFRHTVVTYVNMCDTDLEPATSIRLVSNTQCVTET